MLTKCGWMSLPLLLGGLLGFCWTGHPATPAQTSVPKPNEAQTKEQEAKAKQGRKPKAPTKKAPAKALAGEYVYTSRAFKPSGYANGKPKDILDELDRLVTTRFPKKYPQRSMAHLHPWRKNWDKFLGALDAHRQTSVFVLQCNSFQDAVSKTSDVSVPSDYGKLKSSEPTWVLAYLGFAYGNRPIGLKSVTVSGGQIRLEYTRIRLDDPQVKQQRFGPSFGGGAWGTTRW